MLTDLVRETLRKAVIFLAFFFCLVGSRQIFENYVAFDKFANDFGVYWRAANQPLDQVYFWKGRFPFPYAPTMLLWIKPLTFVPKWPAYFAFTGASLVAFILAFRPYVPKPAIFLALISPPVVRGLFTGQVCALMAALTIWACATASRMAAGIAFGIIASIKPQLVLMAPLMLALNRDWRAFLWSGVTFVAIVLLSLVLFGPVRWPEWLASMDHFHRAVTGTGVITVAVSSAAVAERFGYPPLPAMLLGTVAGAATVYLCKSREPLEKAAAITLGSIMAAPYALVYDLAAVMPLIAIATFRGHILTPLGLASSIHPIPMVVSTFELLRVKRSYEPRHANVAGGAL